MAITLRKTLITAAALLPLTLWAQEFDRSRYPDYTTRTIPTRRSCACSERQDNKDPTM